MKKLFTLILLILPLEVFAETQWPPKQASDLKGLHACDFPKEADYGLFSMPVPDRPGFSFNYRHKGEIDQYVLLIKEQGKNHCNGIIIGTLKLPLFPPDRHKAAPDESKWAIELECRFLGRHWSKNIPAIGIVDQELPQGYFKPIKAWKVDTNKGEFIPVDSDCVVCARFNDSGD